MPRTAEPVPVDRSAQTEAGVDLRAYWRVVIARRWLILAVVAAAVLVTLLVSLRQTQQYLATTTIVIDLNMPRLLNKDQVADVIDSGAGNFWSTKEYFETQYKILTSRAVARRVVDKLQLARDLRFLGLEGEKEETVAAALKRVDAADVLRSRLTINPVKDSRVVRIQVLDRDPRWAATLADAVAEAYVAESLSVRSSTTRTAADWLEEQLADLERKLARSADELFRFKQAHDIVGTSWEDRQSMVSQRLAAVNDALTRARVTSAQLEARAEEIAKLSDNLDGADQQSEAFALVSQSTTVHELKARYFEAQIACAEADASYLQQHPRVIGCDAKLKAARTELLNEVRSILEGARREYLQSVETERKLGRLLDQTKADAFRLNQHEREYLELKRAHDNNQRLYDLVLQRLKETGVTGMMQMSNVRILDRAESPRVPDSPRPVRNVAIALVLGVLAGVALAFLLESLDTTVTSREQIEERLGIPFLGIIPSIASEKAGASPELMIAERPQSVPAECLRAIRTSLLFMSPERPLRTILVTSSAPGEGKTTTSVSLAEIMADGGNRVLLVEADMRRPRLRKLFDVSADEGLSSVIVGGTRLDAAVHATAVENLFVLPCGPIPPNPAELLHTDAFKSILVEAARQFDRVIIDSPPVGVVADAVVISTLVDGTLFVAKAGRTSRDAAARAVRNLVDVKARLLGAILNDMDVADRKYAEYYTYYKYGYGSDRREKRRAGSTAA